MRKDIIKTKLDKLENLKRAGMEVYPEKVERSFANRKALDKFDNIKDKIFLAGRIRSLRPMGKSAFTHIEDESGKIQLFLSEKNIGKEKYKLFVKNIEIGDFIQAEGKLFKTKTGEKTLEVNDWKILSKNMRPIPAEYYGIKDTEELLRKRYLDILINPETKEIFKKKNVFWQTVRNFLSERGFLETQTPVLENVPGGAEARPFITRHNILNRDFYLRISLELPLKKLLIGGYEKVFEIGRVFRNEGIDREHLQEFDHMEFYWAYANMEEGMKLTEKMFKVIAKNVVGNKNKENKIITEYKKQEIIWSEDFPRLDYFEEFKKETGIDLNEDVSVEDLKKKADELKIEYKNSYGKGRMIDAIYKKTIRQKLIQPCFLIGHPIEVSPLAKKDSHNSKKVLRFQPVACQSELGNGFSELNNPLEQRKRFEEQVKLRKAGDKEAQMMSEDFIEALEYGMPPAVGFGMSERLFAILMNKPVRETVIFPPMRENKKSQ
ncbi:lysine--tRNA ligase [bacterium]|nr:lysine--tRNA ligase [bacterium]